MAYPQQFKKNEIKYKNQIRTLALKASNKVLLDYLDEFDHILLKYGADIIEIKKGVNALNQLHYAFYVSSKKELDALVNKAIKIAQNAKAQDYKNYFDVIIPRFTSISKIVIEQPLKIMFGGGFSDDIRKLIEQKRALQGLDLSKSLWKYTKDGQKSIWQKIYDGLQNNKSLSEVRKDVSQFLTEEGKQNLNYNIKRLYVSETNNAYMRSAEYLTKTADFVEEIHIFRSPNGDPNCDICNELVGDVGGPGVDVDKNFAEYPPYHSFCMCDYVDVLPSKEDFIKYLEETYG